MSEWRTSAADIEAIVAARHADPFTVLGPHLTGAGLAVRALVPDAAALALLADDGTTLARFARRQEAGSFETCLAKHRNPFSYRLRADNSGGAWQTIVSDLAKGAAHK